MKFFFVLGVFLYAQLIMAQKKAVLAPFQASIKECLNKSIDVKKIDTNKKLYDVVKQHYPLSSNETLFREVSYSLKGQEKKLKFEDGVIQIYDVNEDDESLKLTSSEKFDENKVDALSRHKIRSADARINQLLFRADIKSDYQKTKEIRSKQVELNIIWSDNQIKSLNIDFLTEKKVLSCLQKDRTDICNCRL